MCAEHLHVYIYICLYVYGYMCMMIYVRLWVHMRIVFQGTKLMLVVFFYPSPLSLTELEDSRSARLASQLTPRIPCPSLQCAQVTCSHQDSLAYS